MFAMMLMVVDVLGSQPPGRLEVQEGGDEALRKAGLVDFLKESVPFVVKALETHIQSPAVCNTG